MKMVQIASSKLLKEQRSARNELSQHIAIWANNALVKGAGPAHKYTKKDVGLPSPAEQCVVGGQWQDELLQVMEHRSAAWS
eukprot:7804823-Heterocapsa_arctica.AAC.1